MRPIQPMRLQERERLHTPLPPPQTLSLSHFALIINVALRGGGVCGAPTSLPHDEPPQTLLFNLDTIL